MGAEPSELPFVTGGFSSHMFGLAETIELGRSLGRLPSKMLLLALPGKSYQMGKKLMDEKLMGEKLNMRTQFLVEQARQRVVDFLRREGGYA